MSDRELATAVGIGRRLQNEALWHKGRCNWVGAWPAEGTDGSIAITYSALGPDLYGGTAGVALFLAELYAATGEQDLRNTALGALRHALAGASRLAPAVRPALYSGAVGIALAAALASRSLGEQAPDEAIAELVAVEPSAESEQDLMNGDAGTVLALLILAELTGDDRHRARAVRFGASLLAHAVRTREALSWRSRHTPGEPQLTGLSHGASGCALALLELWQATGETSYRDDARRAMAYERSQFDADAANWPDLRGLGGNRSADRRSFATLWCHGAPGIALARLRAVELDADERALGEAQVALRTTRQAVEAELARGGNFSLCHGLAGNAEILLHGAQTLDAQSAENAELVRRVATEGIQRYVGRSWPCGTFEGEACGLFLGLAGIGRFYLRLHDPTLPSLLLPVPSSYCSPSSLG
jgi:lantibiotic modifying enzyme